MATLLYKDRSTGKDKHCNEINIRFMLVTADFEDSSRTNLAIQFETREDPEAAGLLIGLDELFGRLRQEADADHCAATAYKRERDGRDASMRLSAVKLMQLNLDLMKALSKQAHELADAYDREIPKLTAWVEDATGTEGIAPPFMKLPDGDA